MKSTKLISSFCLFLLLAISPLALYGQQPAMYYGDTFVEGRPFAKDPYVIYFKDQYWMYYTVPDAQKKVLHIGIATSSDLTTWKKVGNIFGQPGTVEANGICAPSALIKDGVLHLFYQSYGNAKLDAICHAQSSNGLDFERDASNPIFRPKAGDWSCGRAIDAEVVLFKNQYFLYYATRDTSYKIQQQGVAIAPVTTNFSRNDWKEVPNMPILKPELDWEKKCIEAASCIQKGKYLYMFYAGAYNNEPQQIGLARSKDGIHWTRVSKEPFLKNGEKGSWNESESGHPHVFKAQDGRHYLFFQGNNDKGKTWYLSKVAIEWRRKRWVLKDETNPLTSSKPGTTPFVDAQSGRRAKPFWVGDSLTKAATNWQLVFSDEFNDSQIDTTKWTVENSIKKRKCRNETEMRLSTTENRACTTPLTSPGGSIPNINLRPPTAILSAGCTWLNPMGIRLLFG
jgi:beta-1,2-mannobiose phosphorylase / 1,2-beta-oligomannan phosphorylase